MREKFKQILNYINFKKTINIVFILFTMSSIISLLKPTEESLKCSIILGIICIIIYIFALIKALINKNKNVIAAIEKFGVVICLIICIIINMNIFIPKCFPDRVNEMYQLFTSLFSAMIAGLIGVLGTYFGSIYGGEKTLEAVEKQLVRQEEEKIQKEKENKEIIIRIITKFLKEEIVDNGKSIGNKFYENLNKGFDTQYTYNFKKEIKFDSYEKVKYELIKYTSESLVEDVIDLYELFYLLVRYNDINELSEKEYNKLKGLNKKLDTLINNLDFLNGFI